MEKASKNNKILQKQAIILKSRSMFNESCDVNFSKGQANKNQCYANYIITIPTIYETKFT